MSPVKLVLAAGFVLAASVTLSFVHPFGNPRFTTTGNTVLMDGSTTLTPEVRQVLASKCADCHSNATHWPAYSRVAPGSWLIERDVAEGREHLNLSEWQNYDADRQIDLLGKIASEARAGGMPVKQYLWLHPSARLSDPEQQLLYVWARTERKRIKNQHPQPEQEQGRQ
jgi:cytochrome c